MRFAIVSDIHANLQAWNAAMLDIRCNDVDKIVCLGDVVGYGPNPAEVLRSVHANVDYLVLGNHDAVVCGKMDPQLFNDEARQIIEWTKGKLNGNAVRFLKTLPLSLSSAHFRCTHGEFSRPEAFLYIIDPEDALASWHARTEQLLFVGHTHTPAIYLLGQSGNPHIVAPQDFLLEEGKRYLVNCGSIGQPRDGEPRASYCIFDSSDRSLCWRRIPFDIDAYRNALQDSGLPSSSSYFLRHDPLSGTPPIRELLNFSPPASAEKSVRNTVAVHDMAVLQKRVSRWRGIAALAIILSVLTVTGGGWAWWQQAGRAQTIEPFYFAPIMAASATASGMSSRQRSPVPSINNLLPQPTGSTLIGKPIEGWSISLGDRRKHSVHINQSTGTPHFIMSSSSEDTQISIRSCDIKVRPAQRFRLYCELQKSPDFSGQVAAHVNVSTEGRNVDYDWSRNPADARLDDTWQVARRVFPRKSERLPAARARISISVRGRFRGTVTLRNIGLARLP